MYKSKKNIMESNLKIAKRSTSKQWNDRSLIDNAATKIQLIKELSVVSKEVDSPTILRAIGLNSATLNLNWQAFK